MKAPKTAPEIGGNAMVSVSDSSAADPESCAVAAPDDPCAIVILGATGDLTARKLMPALFDLFRNNGLPRPLTIVGCGRSALSRESFRHRMHQALAAPKGFDAAAWEGFAKMLHYRQLDYKDPEAFTALAAFLKKLDRQKGTRGNCIFYLALPPSLYAPVAQAIGGAGLGAENQNGNGWSRIVVEKPFGRNLQTAVELDRKLQEYFKEYQIFRIDHYLAKETVQNVLMFRFANSIFEPVWNRRFIDHINITATETLGVEHRAGYYEQSGVLRDMFQNHMMMLLALIAMEPPARFEAEQVRDERIKVFRALRPIDLDHLTDFLVLGQYGPGRINNAWVPGYREEPGVDPHSVIPTYAKMKLHLDNWRWQGVPFYLTSGKRLRDKVTEIAIQFKAVPYSMFRRVLGTEISANRLTIGIYPDEKITLTFQTKHPGSQVCLRPVTMDFVYQQNYTGPLLDAYEKVLVDCMLGDQMLFWRQDGVEHCWHFLTPILDQCESCLDLTRVLQPYAAGSWGPSAIEGLGPRALPDAMGEGQT